MRDVFAVVWAVRDWSVFDAVGVSRALSAYAYDAYLQKAWSEETGLCCLNATHC